MPLDARPLPLTRRKHRIHRHSVPSPVLAEAPAAGEPDPYPPKTMPQGNRLILVLPHSRRPATPTRLAMHARASPTSNHRARVAREIAVTAGIDNSAVLAAAAA